MRLVINNREISEPIENILKELKKEAKKDIFRDIINKGDNIAVTCPAHKDGRERHPSCYIYNKTDGDCEYGTVHCFTCGYKASLSKMISDVLDISPEESNQWLVDNFGNTFITKIDFDTDISLKQEKQKYMDESILDKYDYYHPYMWKRKLTKEVVDQFRVGYDKELQAITFPVYDERHRLVMITARSVNSKRFWIPKNVEKPVYLLYDILDRGIDTVFITEAQIDALTAMGWGYPCVATMGCPSKRQIDILNRSGIRSIIAIFDNDASGARFSLRLKENLRKDIFFDTFSWIGLNKKDINDFSRDEFDHMMLKQGFSCVKLK